MYTLFLDTHANEVVVVLFKDKKIVDSVNKLSGYQHSQVALPTVKEVLDKEGIRPNDLGQIIVVTGPGSFTGVRIAVTIAKTMAYSLNIPIKTVDSLLLEAISYDSDKNFIVAVSEKNGAYIGKFTKDKEKIEEYYYLSKSEYNELLKSKEVINDISINYERLIDYVDRKDCVNPHAVKPLYIKRIEVLK